MYSSIVLNKLHVLSILRIVSILQLGKHLKNIIYRQTLNLIITDFF